MIPIYMGAAISNTHILEDRNNDPKSYEPATESALGEKWDMAMNYQLDVIRQHQIFGDLVVLQEGGYSFDKSLGIQDEVQWRRQCAVVQSQVSIWRKSLTRRH